MPLPVQKPSPMPSCFAAGAAALIPVDFPFGVPDVVASCGLWVRDRWNVEFNALFGISRERIGTIAPDPIGALTGAAAPTNVTALTRPRTTVVVDAARRMRAVAVNSHAPLT